MAEFPALPIFTDAYLGDTRHLTTAQHGAYFLLLMIAWRSAGCALPDDDVFLSRCVGMDRRTWLSNKPVVMAFWFQNTDGKWQQKRLLDERNFAEQVRLKNSAAGRASALKRLNRGSTSVQPERNETPTPSPSPSPTVSSEGKPSSDTHVARASDLPSPEFLIFWESYPRTSCSRGEAWKSYKRAIARGANHEDIANGLRQYRNFVERTGTPAAHATTWLNNDRWGVDYAAAIAEREKRGGSCAPAAGRRPTNVDRTRAAAERVLFDLGLEPG